MFAVVNLPVLAMCHQSIVVAVLTAVSEGEVEVDAGAPCRVAEAERGPVVEEGCANPDRPTIFPGVLFPYLFIAIID